MFEDRNLKLDLFALALLVIVVFLGLALASYNPADAVGELVAPLDKLYQPDTLVFPRNEQVSNICGPWGALIADMMLTGLGIGAYYMVLSLAALDVALLRRSDVDSPLMRSIGWVASLTGIVTLAALLAPHMSPGPVIGPGGYLGTLVRGLLELRFALIGSVIIAMSLLVGGLLLCTDYMLIRFVRTVAAGLTTVAGKTSGLRRVRDGTRRHDTGEYDDEYDEEEIAEEEELDETAEPAVRIRGRKVEIVAEEELEEEEEDDDAYLEDEEYEEEPEEEAEEEYDQEDEDDGLEDELDEEDKEPSETPVIESPAANSKKSGKDQKRRRADEDHDSSELKIRKPKEKSERDKVIAELNEASRSNDPTDYQLPEIDLLVESEDICFEEQAKEVRRKARILEKTFANFGFNVKVVEIETGPVIAQYEVALEAGLRLSKITGLADDLAIALRVPCVRIVAPIPGKNTVGIEVPNAGRQVVRMREVIEEANGKVAKMRIPLFLGKDVSGNPLTVDLSTLPHLLIAGRTGTGKSVALNTIISSILMTKRPDEVRMLMIDPKMVELSGYGRLPHLMHPVITDMKKAEAILAWAVDKMEERYALLARAGVRHISSYNQLGEEELMDRLQPETDEEREAIPQSLPFIVIVADEMADLMMTAGKEVEQHIIRLAQKSRAVGIHLILATQKPTVDVITGLIKSNLPARISFQVASRTDSRVVLDEMGAEKLLGNGDMLFLWPGTSTLLRAQGTYLTDEEIDAVTDFVSTGEQDFVNELVNIKVEDQEDAAPGQLKKRDELYEGAVDVVVREGRGSVSLLQRALGIGYGRAARLIDYMAEDGIVGAYAGSQAREVLISMEDWEKMQAGDADEPANTIPAIPDKPVRKRINKIKPDPDWSDGEDDDGSADAGPPPAPKSARSKAKPKRKKRLPAKASQEASATAATGVIAYQADKWQDQSEEDDESAPWDETDDVATTESQAFAEPEFDEDQEDAELLDETSDELEDLETDEELEEDEYESVEEEEYLEDDETETAHFEEDDEAEEQELEDDDYEEEDYEDEEDGLAAEYEEDDQDEYDEDDSEEDELDGEYEEETYEGDQFDEDAEEFEEEESESDVAAEIEEDDDEYDDEDDEYEDDEVEEIEQFDDEEYEDEEYEEDEYEEGEYDEEEYEEDELEEEEVVAEEEDDDQYEESDEELTDEDLDDEDYEEEEEIVAEDATADEQSPKKSRIRMPKFKRKAESA